MAGRQLGALSRRLIEAGWPADAPVSVVSRAGWPDQLHSDHQVASLAGASMLHAGRPTVVTVGAGAHPVRLAAVRGVAGERADGAARTTRRSASSRPGLKIRGLRTIRVHAFTHPEPDP